MNDNKKQTRKDFLLSQSYGTLQSTPEYKNYLENYVYSESRNMTPEVEYILKKSYEDDDAPLSYNDYEHFYFDEDELITAIISDLEDSLESDDLSDFENLVYMIDSDIKTKNVNSEDVIKEVETYLNDCDVDDLKTLIDGDISHLISFNLYDYEREREVYQWFLMSNFICQELEKRDEVVLNGEYWGRQCCGQAIELDHIIIRIFKEEFLNMYWVESEFKLDEEYKEEKV